MGRPHRPALGGYVYHVLNAPNTQDIKKIKSAMVERRWTAGGWHDNPYFKNGFKLFSLLGAASVTLTASETAHAMWSFDEADIKPLVDKAQKIKAKHDPMQKLADTIEWLTVDVKEFLRPFVPNDTVLKAALAIAVRQVLVDSMEDVTP